MTETFMQPPDTPTLNTGANALSSQQWKEATRFDGTDIGWIVMSIGMAIGAGIVFLPVQVGLMGVWVFLLSACRAPNGLTPQDVQFDTLKVHSRFPV